MEISHFENLGDTSERSCSSPRRVSNLNSKEPHMGIYLHIKFERDRLEFFGVRVHVV